MAIAASSQPNKQDKTPSPRGLCSQPVPKPIILPPELAGPRLSAIMIGAKKWANGTVLHYHFLERADAPSWRWVEAQKAIVRWATQQWIGLNSGLSFKEVSDPTEAEILIGCLVGDGSWSLVGTDNLDLNYRDLGRTMNFGWDLTTTWGKATAIHELGHAIGLSHEHQNYQAGIVWNEDKVYEYFSGPPNNWSPAKIRHNILDKLSPSESEGSKWDPLSIMEYPFQPGLIRLPKPYDTNGIPENTVISSGDAAWVRTWYPPLTAAQPIAAMQLQALNAAAGQQRDFSFQPDATREYVVGIVGRADCRVVVFEMRDGTPRHLASGDDSGSDENIRLKVKLVKGRDYIIRTRVNFTADPAGAGLLIY